MKSVKFSWVLGAVAALGLGMAAEACSSSSSPSNLGPGGSGTGSGTGTGTAGTGTGTGGTGTGTGGSGTGATCYKAPKELHPEPDGGGIYCPFSETTDGGKDKYCTPGSQHCCEPSSGGSTCEAIGTACASDTDWQCEGTPDCAGMPGTVCCGTGTIKPQGAQPGCAADGGTVASFPYVSGFKGSKCQATCAGTAMAPEFQVCSDTVECPTGVTCVPVEPKGNTIGYCLFTDAGAGTGTGTGAGTGTGTGTATDAGHGDAAGDAKKD